MEQIDLPLQLAISKPEQNCEGRWIFVWMFQYMDNKTFKIRSRDYVFYTLGMDGVAE